MATTDLETIALALETTLNAISGTTASLLDWGIVKPNIKSIVLHPGPSDMLYGAAGGGWEEADVIGGVGYMKRYTDDATWGQAVFAWIQEIKTAVMGDKTLSGGVQQMELFYDYRGEVEMDGMPHHVIDLRFLISMISY